MITKQANWNLKQDFIDYLKKLRDEGEIIEEIRLDSKVNPKNIEIIMQDNNAKE